MLSGQINPMAEITLGESDSNPLARTMGESHSRSGCVVENINYPSVQRINIDTPIAGSAA